MKGKQHLLSRMQSISDLPAPVSLHWQVSDDVMADIELASEQLDRSVRDRCPLTDIMADNKQVAQQLMQFSQVFGKAA